jgi:hypothetical protein
MHKKYLAKSKLISKEFLDFNKKISHIEKTFQKNNSGQLYIDTYGNETESTQALDTPKKKEKDFLNLFKQNMNTNNNENNHMIGYNVKNDNLNKIKSNFIINNNNLNNDNDEYLLEEIKMKKTNELKKMINKIDLTKIPNKKNYASNLDEEETFYNSEQININERHSLKYNLNPKNSENNYQNTSLEKRNSCVNKGYNTNKNIKFDLDGSLTVINEKDSSCERIMESGEKFLKKISEEKKNKIKNLNEKNNLIENNKENKENKLTNDEERIAARKKFEKCIKKFYFLLFKNYLKKIVCNNVCIRENKIFQVNKILADVFQNEAKSLRIDALKQTESNQMLTSEAYLPSKVKGNVIPEKRRSSKHDLDDKRNFLF